MINYWYGIVLREKNKTVRECGKHDLSLSVWSVRLGDFPKIGRKTPKSTNARLKILVFIKRRMRKQEGI